MGSYDQDSVDAFGPPPGQQAQAQAPQDDMWSRHFQMLTPEQAQMVKSAATGGGGSITMDPDLQGLTGKDYIEALRAKDPAFAGRLERVGRGDESYPTGFQQKLPQNQQLMRALTFAYPNYQQYDFQQRQSQAKNYKGGGKQFQELQAIGTVSGHLQDLMKAADDLHNFEGAGPLNAPLNSLLHGYREMSQDPRLAVFDTTKNAVTRELTKAYQGGHITDSAVSEWSQQINSAQTPSQLRAVIGKLNDLLQSKRSAIEEGWRTTMDDVQPNKEFTTENARVKSAFDRVNAWAHPDQAASAPAPTPAAPAAAPKPGNYIYIPGKGLVPR